jgi:hypothetical protein
MGAIVGGGFTLVGGIGGAIILDRLAERRHRRRQQELRKTRLSALTDEMAQNIHLLDHPPDLSNVNVRLLTDAWNEAIGDLLNHSEQVATTVRSAYAEVHKFNGYIDFALAGTRLSPMLLTDKTFRQQASVTKSALEKSLQALSGVPI